MANIINPVLPYILTNGTLADATQVMADFASIISQVNANAVEVGSILSGSLVNLQFFTVSGTYTPSANATKALVLGQGAGGAGGGTQATSGTTVSAGSGARSGTQALLYIASGLVSLSVTCGAGGTGVTGGSGGNGGNSSFGGYLILPGGTGGGIGGVGGGSANSADIGAVPPFFPSSPSGSGTLIWTNQGKGGTAGLILFNPIGGNGGDSLFGSGGIGETPGSGSGTGATGFGAGGAGASRGPSSTAAPGLAGTGAAFLVLEFA